MSVNRTKATTKKRKKAKSIIVDDVRTPPSVKLVIAPPPEASAPPPEASAPPPEASAPPPEASAPPPEASAPPPEASALPPEASAPPPEASAPPPEPSAPPPRKPWLTMEDSCLFGNITFIVQFVQLVPIVMERWKERQANGMPFHHNLWQCLTKECYQHLKGCMGWFWTLKTPVLVLGAIAIAPKMLLLWMLIVVAKPISVWIYRHLPTPWQVTLAASLPSQVRQSEFVRELNEGADQGLPFILFWLYLCCVPFSLTWIAVHWFKGLFPEPEPKAPDEEGFVYVQNRRADRSSSEANFYSSRAFGPVVFLFFALGIPAFVSYGVYQHVGMEQVIQSQPLSLLPADRTPSMPGVLPPRLWIGQMPSKRMQPTSPQSKVISIGPRFEYEIGPPAPYHPPKAQDQPVTVMPPTKAAPLAENSFGTAEVSVTEEPQLTAITTGTVGPQGPDDPTVIMGYNGYWPWLHNFGVEPSKASVFFVHFYLVSLASAMCVLFFRAWFQFPLEFISDEHEVEFTGRGVRRRSFKGWFKNVLTMNGFGSGAGPDELHWNEIHSLRKLDEGFTRLYPLPEAAFKKESLTYKMLNKVAALIDGLSVRMNTDSRYLVFSATAAGSDLRRNIKINLNDLNREQRARLFYAVKKWAPHVVIHESAEEQLIGSTVLRDNRYTQLWFDMLTSKSRTRRKTALNAGDSLKNGDYQIAERISSGGQATTYTAMKASGEKVVLKEFILSTSADSAAMVESAREFEAEVSLLSQLDHPGIVKLQDFFFEQGRVYVVLEHIDGQSLRQRVQENGPLSEAEVVRIGKSMCTVLEYLHGGDPPIVHRDITPENILITAAGDVKVIDFSLAVRQDGRQTTGSCAKQCFTPPEQFREEVTVQSDLYSLGATLYYLLTGSTPKPISCSSPKQKAAQVSSELSTIVERATKLDLKDRYETAAWLRLDLDQLK